MIRPSRSPSSIKAGDALGVLQKRFTSVDLVAYGAATWDWHRLHYDVEFARSKQLPNVLVDGQVFGALFARALQDWAGPRGFITRLSLKMKSIAVAGDTLVASGEVTGIRAGDGVSHVTVTQSLKIESRVVAEAVSEVRLPNG
jgi:acyl dehydratase